MHFRKILLASVTAAAVLSVGGGAMASASVVPVKYETGSCGPACIEPFFPLASGYQTIEKVQNGLNKQNNPVNMNYALGQSGYSQDFTPDAVGVVDGTFCPAGSVAATDPLFTPNQCASLDNRGYGSDTAYELEYTPYGTQPVIPLCVGVDSAVVHFRARLLDCGVDGRTIWISDNQDERLGARPFINGGSSNFSHPLVLTETTSAPGFQELRLEPVNVDTHGIVAENQLMAFLPGV